MATGLKPPGLLRDNHPGYTRQQVKYGMGRYRDVFRRIGALPQKQMAWLLKFQATELYSWNEDRITPILTFEEWERLRQEVMAFRVLATGEPTEKLGDWVLPAPDNPEKAWDAVHQARDLAQRAVRTLAVSGRVEFPPFKKITLAVCRFPLQIPPQPPPPPPLPHLLQVGSLYFVIPDGDLTAPGFERLTRDPFIVQVARVLSHFAEKLFLCPSRDCNKPFLATRRTQRFCSNTCRSREAMRALREAQRQKILMQTRKRTKKPENEAQRTGRKGEMHHGKTRR